MAAKLDKQLEKLLKFVDGRADPKMDQTAKVERTVDTLLNSCDIYLDRIEQFGELKRKVVFVPKEQQRTSLAAEDPFAHIKAQSQNDERFPFIPLIRVKPHGIKELSPLIVKAAADPNAFFKGIIDPENYEFEHPYEAEIRAAQPLTFTQLESLFSRVTLDRGLGGKLSYVYTEEQLTQCVNELSMCPFIAIDLEFNLDHSFQGFCCLMQITGNETDYIIDPLALFDRLSILNVVFANPKILKIFHGCDSDLMMLQKDFGVYVVNLIDTYRLAQATNHESCALGSLL